MSAPSKEQIASIDNDLAGYEPLNVHRVQDRLIGRPAVSGTMSLHPEIAKLFKSKGITRSVSKCGVVYVSPSNVRQILDRERQLPRWPMADIDEMAQTKSSLLDISRMAIKALPTEARTVGNSAVELQASVRSDNRELFLGEQRIMSLQYDVPEPDTLTIYLGHLEGPVDQETLDLATHALDVTSPTEFRVGKIALL